MQFKVLIATVFLQFISTIEVHENPVENTTESEVEKLKTTLPNSAVLSGTVVQSPTEPVTVSEPDGVRKPVVTNGVTPTSKPDSDYGILGNSNYHQHHRQKQTANNHKHSSSYRDTPLVVTPTVSSSTSSSSSSPSTTTTTSATSGSSGSTFKEYVTSVSTSSNKCTFLDKYL